VADDVLDTAPLIRFGGKGKNAHHLIPHFPRAVLYAEPFFGAGGLFFRLPPGMYERETVNDLDASLVTFFRVLRDRPEELQRVVDLTPCARDEFAAALEHSPDELEEARRVFIRSRQGFAGQAGNVGNWGRAAGDVDEWMPTKSVRTADRLPLYARRLRNVAIDSIDGAEFVRKWGKAGTFLYCDPPYVPETRKGSGDYRHEMTAEDHRRLAAELHAAVERGAKVALSGYPSALYDELFPGWRCERFDVPLHGTRHPDGARRVECLWMSYPPDRQPSLFGEAADAR